MAALCLSGVMIFNSKTGVAMVIKHFSRFWGFFRFLQLLIIFLKQFGKILVH